MTGFASSRDRSIADPFPIIPLGGWLLEIMQGVLASVAPSTFKVYKRAITKLWDFFRDVGMQPRWPVDSDTVMQFLLWLKHAYSVPKAMAIHLAGISFFSKAGGFADPCSSFLIRKAFDGWKRLYIRAKVPDDLFVSSCFLIFALYYLLFALPITNMLYFLLHSR